MRFFEKPPLPQNGQSFQTFNNPTVGVLVLDPYLHHISLSHNLGKYQIDWVFWLGVDQCFQTSKSWFVTCWMAAKQKKTCSMSTRVIDIYKPIISPF